MHEMSATPSTDLSGVPQAAHLPSGNQLLALTSCPYVLGSYLSIQGPSFSVLWQLSFHK